MTFPGFSEAARLYAANIEVVREMQKAYKTDVLACLESLERELQRLLAPEELNVYETKDKNRYLWLGKKQPRGEVPYLWFTNYDPDEIDHQGVVLTAGYDPKDDGVLEGLHELRARREDLGLEPIEGTSRYYIFSVSIDFAGEDFVDVGARHLAEVLKEMNEVARAIRGRKRTR